MEFSGVSPPKLAMVTAESVGLLKRSSSEHVPKNTLPLALKRASRPVPVAGGAAEVGDAGAEVGGGGGGACELDAGRHCE